MLNNIDDATNKKIWRRQATPAKPDRGVAIASLYLAIYGAGFCDPSGSANAANSPALAGGLARETAACGLVPFPFLMFDLVA